MRLITQNKVAVGISISRIFSVGFSFLSFMKRKLERNSRVEHIKGR
ncbi:hypothetical Protein YC6258_03600 [Gynuella sunshinyii YC6258]|uniref:Uncharacterized protein n=2 Tax=Gynuella sunshinyii TaxID=1445505 RepID=A0A0C5VMV4_9GAMM|nr:hypothetical Protein YC6258_03600 [Gynuella sunshinyii YC6258]